MIPKLMGYICAFIALAIAVVKQINPGTTILRSVVCYIVGWVAASILLTLLHPEALNTGKPEKEVKPAKDES